MYQWNNLSSKFFNFKFNIETPQILEFYVNDKHRYRFYIIPGSTNDIVIDQNEYTIEGPTKKENDILRQFGFDRAALKRPKFKNNRDIEGSLHELNMVCDSLENVLNSNHTTEDFKRYINSEMYGFRYFWKSNLLYQYTSDTLGIDTLPMYIIENIRSLTHFTLSDETRSRYCLNAVSSYFQSNLYLQLSKEEEANYSIFIWASLQSINNLFSNYPNVSNILKVSVTNTAVYIAKTQSEIELAQYIYTYFRDHIPNQENSFNVIANELKNKIIRIELLKLQDYLLIDTRDSSINLSEMINSNINVINFWASWCQPCIEKMPELISKLKSKNINLVNINIWSAKTTWNKIIVLNPENISNHYLFADKDMSNVLAEACSITQFPLYLIVDNNLNIVSIIESYPDLVNYISSQ